LAVTAPRPPGGREISRPLMIAATDGRTSVTAGGTIIQTVGDRRPWARVVLTLRDGRTLERHIAHNLGTPDNPMTDRQLEDKFVALAAPVLGRPSTDELAQVCWKLLELDDIRAVTDLAVPPI